MMWWLLAAGVGAAAIVAWPPPFKPLLFKVSMEPQRVADDAPSPQQGQRDEVIGDYLGEKYGPWSCKSGDKQIIPDLGKYVPPQLQAAGGPIVQAVLTMTDALRDIFDAIGWKPVCTVRGGRYVPVVSWARLPARIVQVSLEPMYGGAPAGEIVFSSEPNPKTDTGPLTVKSKIVEPAPRQVYLMNGGVPPSDLWPHKPGIPTWESSVTPDYDVPRAEVVRNGDELTLYVWLPPRAPRSHNTAWGNYKIDHPVTWRVQWLLV